MIVYQFTSMCTPYYINVLHGHDTILPLVKRQLIACKKLLYDILMHYQMMDGKYIVHRAWAIPMILLLIRNKRNYPPMHILSGASEVMWLSR